MTRSTVSQVVQIGVEVTPGTAVASSRLLQSMSIEPAIKAEVATFRPAGGKFATVAALGKEWVQAKVTGQPTYTEIIYPLCGVLKNVTPTTVETTGRRWTFSPSQSAADTCATFTVEQGSSARAHEFAYGTMTELGLTFSRGGIELDGTMIGRAIQDGITMTATPTALALVPILPTQVDIFLAATAAGLAGASPLTLPISAEWRIADRFGPIFALNSTQSSFTQPIELVPAGTAKLKLAADATGMALLATMRQGATQFMRIRAQGDILATTERYGLVIDTALKVTDVGEFRDEDGLFAIEWTFEWCHDATWGKACEVVVTNLINAL